MARFRKKPVVIEAVQITAADFNGKTWDGSPFSEKPNWLEKALRTGEVSVHPDNRDYAMWKIKTLSGPVIAGPGWWIIQGVQDELYPCKPGIFEATYESLEN